MNDAELDALLTKHCADQYGLAKAAVIIGDLQKVGILLHDEKTRAHGERLLDEWQNNGGELRKGLASAWLSRARAAIVRSGAKVGGSKQVQSARTAAASARHGFRAGLAAVGRQYNAGANVAERLGRTAGAHVGAAAGYVRTRGAPGPVQYDAAVQGARRGEGIGAKAGRYGFHGAAVAGGAAAVGGAAYAASGSRQHRQTALNVRAKTNAEG